jgi:mono/diheme cytochrome c family protein
VIAPGLRPPPAGGLGPGQAYAIVAYMRKQRVGVDPPAISAGERQAAMVLGTYCATCHMIDGDGASAAPDLSRIGAAHDANWLREWITAPEEVDPFATMPAFGTVLSDAQMTALVNYLAARK